ncbi:hypothetical protein [Adhaeribacter pallidiroseus]|uniref:Ppx/GppA phosphatase domain-containing protein n=1 Tax=Adhaeribacter pallidiroseus TaxID=2072847 RepID=A0A369QFB9_9BACT|nr:hypothetical protein [Adhaeribacter pallidiroseus]RDC63611.1 hypothetical protein AHMF7616_02216 [Adhaeribacter pallidiroseus]
MRLKPAGIIVILLIIGVLAYFAIGPRLSEIRKENSNPIATTPPAADNSVENSGTAATTPSTSSGNQKATTPPNSEDREFNYTPEKPENGTLRGVVEVGATGFNSFVINMDSQKRWEIVSKDFGQSLAYEGLATTEDIRTGLKKYLASMFDKGVSKNNMHFVISSGAQKEPKTSTISNELKKVGYVVNNVTAAQEGKFGFRATVPPAFADNSFLVDIGSGNTKISWEENGDLKSIELPGAKYYEKGTSDEQVYNTVKAQVSKIPENKRNVGFVLGGVPFTLANQHRNGEERYTVLKNPGDYKAADKKMAAGLNIYKGIVDATNTDTFVFDWDANFTIGFLLSLNK